MRSFSFKERGCNRRHFWKAVIRLCFSLALVGTILLSNTGRSTESIDMLASLSKENIGGFRFEVEGKVQNVSFRKYTQKQAREIGDVVGWIRNTARGTVEGEVVSRSLEKRQHMREWLGKTGSPRSEIRNATFDELPLVQAQKLMNTLEDFVIEQTTRRG
jgi:acylphosphatase